MNFGSFGGEGRSLSEGNEEISHKVSERRIFQIEVSRTLVLYLRVYKKDKVTGEEGTRQEIVGIEGRK